MTAQRPDSTQNPLPSPSSWVPEDDIFMEEALKIACLGLGHSSPNPSVGCVIVNSAGSIVGQGHTQPFGGLHAEPVALAQAGSAAAGATAYVTLMPCAHYGKTPPCTDALIHAGIRRVVAAMDDPNPTSLQGRLRLEEAGIQVTVGPGREEAEVIMAGFLKHLKTGLPYLRLKYAMTLDGRIASRTGSSQWISGEESRAQVQRLRRESDAVMIGVNTALQDNPRLHVRSEDGWQPRRVVIDSTGRIDPHSRMISSHGGEVVILTTSQIPGERRHALVDAGTRLIEVSATAEGRVNLQEALLALTGLGIRTILCEGGAGLAGGLLEAGLIDEVIVYLAPRLIGGRDALSPIGGLGIAEMNSALRLTTLKLESIGEDLCIRARLDSHA